MSDRATLEAALRNWHAEFVGMGAAPEKLCGFLALRLSESGLLAVQPDWDVVTADINGKQRNVRIVAHDKGRLHYESTEIGWHGLGLIPVAAVHPDDRGKLAEILDRLESGR